MNPCDFKEVMSDFTSFSPEMIRSVDEIMNKSFIEHIIINAPKHICSVVNSARRHKPCAVNLR
jgi:hypothetical protein